MSIDLRLPDLGEGIESADVLSVLVSMGQAVNAGDSVIEIESEKATLEVPTDAGGTVTGIHVKSGDTIAVGQVVLTLEPDGAELPPSPKPPVAAPEIDEAPGANRRWRVGRRDRRTGDGRRRPGGSHRAALGGRRHRFRWPTGRGRALGAHLRAGNRRGRAPGRGFRDRQAASPSTTSRRMPVAAPPRRHRTLPLRFPTLPNGGRSSVYG